MNYYIKVLLISLISTIIVGVLLALTIVTVKKSNMKDKEKFKLKNMSSVSGIMMIISIIISMTICHFSFFINNKDFIVRLYPLISIIIVYGIVGLFYDLRTIELTKERKKIFITKTLMLSAITIYFIIYILNNIHLGTKTLIPFIKIYVEVPLWIYIPSTICIFLSIIKSVKLTNKIDGLTAIISIIIITILTAIGIILNVEEIAILGIIIIGITLGFLLFNLKPSIIVIGEASTFLLGGTIAIQTLYLRIPLLLLMIAIIPILRIITIIIKDVYSKISSKHTIKGSIGI